MNANRIIKCFDSKCHINIFFYSKLIYFSTKLVQDYLQAYQYFLTFDNVKSQKVEQ